MFSTCNHCNEQSSMPVIECGDFRICAVCPHCTNHKKIGARAAVQLAFPHKTKAAGAE